MKDTFQIVAVFDPIAERATQTSEDTGARVIDSFEALIADEEVELVIVASMNGHHAAQATAALKAGKHVLCEKPFGLTVADVSVMVRMMRQPNRLRTTMVATMLSMTLAIELPMHNRYTKRCILQTRMVVEKMMR